MTENERVRELRKTLGLTLEKFGERLGVKKDVYKRQLIQKAAFGDIVMVCPNCENAAVINPYRKGRADVYKRQTSSEAERTDLEKPARTFTDVTSCRKATLYRLSSHYRQPL